MTARRALGRQDDDVGIPRARSHPEKPIRAFVPRRRSANCFLP